MLESFTNKELKLNENFFLFNHQKLNYKKYCYYLKIIKNVQTVKTFFGGKKLHERNETEVNVKKVTLGK
jgi:hypothetical protein